MGDILVPASATIMNYFSSMPRQRLQTRYISFWMGVKLRLQRLDLRTKELTLTKMTMHSDSSLYARHVQTLFCRARRWTQIHRMRTWIKSCEHNLFQVVWAQASGH